MNRHTPANDFIAALDAPLDFLRQDFGKWAPTLSVLIFSGILLQIPSQFINRYMVEDIQGGNAEAIFTWFPLLLAGTCISLPLLLVGVFAEAVLIGNVLGGRSAGLVEALRPLGRLNYWIALFISGVFNLVAGMTCCFGGFLVWIPLGLVMPIAIEEGSGVAAVQRSVDLGLMRTGPAWHDRPGWKVAALMMASLVLATAAGAVAQVPVFASMGWEFYDALTSGDPSKMATLGTVNPWVATVGMLLGGLVRLFSDAYLWSGLFLIYRDARELASGAGLEAAIEGPAS